MKTTSNIAYVDGQNLRMGTVDTKPSWHIDLKRFRVYLKEKYHVDKAFYYMGYIIDGAEYENLYEHIQESGFILVFREHNSAMLGKKKGNVDSDIILNAMKRIYLKEDFSKFVLVSGDGDYKGLVDFLIEHNKFEKILFPNKKYASSLYKSISRAYYAYLNDTDVRKKIEYRPKKKREP